MPNYGIIEKLVLKMEPKGFEDDGQKTDIPDFHLTSPDHWKTFGAVLFGNDDDKLQDSNGLITLPFPSKYGTEQKQHIERNDDYQLTWRVEIVATPP